MHSTFDIDNMSTYTQTSNHPSDPLYVRYLKQLTELGVSTDEDLIYIKEINLWFRLCNQPIARGRASNFYRLDVLHHPTMPCDARKVKIDVYEPIHGTKVLRGGSHTYLTYLLHKEGKYEITDGLFKKRLSWTTISKPCWGI